MMFHPFHIPVDGIFVDVKKPEELGQEFVPVHDCFCNLLPLWSQGRASILFVFHQTLRVEALKHVCNTGLRDAQALRDVNRSGISLFFYEMQDLLKIVVLGDAAAGSGSMRSHSEKLTGYFGARTEFHENSWRWLLAGPGGRGRSDH